MIYRIPTGAAAGLCSLLAACSSDSWITDADAEVNALLEQRHAQVLGHRERWVIPVQPNPEGGEPGEQATEKAEQRPARAPGQKAAQKPGEEPDTPEAGAGEPPADREALEVDLETALQTAVAHNREYRTQEETLYLQGLGATLAHFEYGPLLRASVSSVWDKVEGQSERDEVLGDLNASQILPTGGRVGLHGALTSARDLGKSLSATIDQPLLRGLGYEVSHDALIQADHDVAYAIRDFELFRQDFTIRVAQTFFGLVSQQKTLAIEEENYRQAVFDREKSETLLKMQRAQEQDVFRARRREIEAEDNLIGARANYRAAIDTFKILLGLPTSTPIHIADQEPPYEPVDVSLQSAVRAARHNRLDILTEKQRLEDAERGVRIAENGLLPDLGLTLGGNVDDSAGTRGPALGSASVRLQLEIPLQRTPERNRYRAARIALERARRGYSLVLDQLELDTRDALRQLRSTELRIQLQRQQIEQQKRTVAITEIRFEQGAIENRDLLEARQSLVDAQNSLIRLLAEHFVRRLRLLRNLGLLFVEEDGTWR